MDVPTATLFDLARAQAPAEPVSLTDQLAAARRELAMRRSAYPRWVAGHKMTQAKADQEIAAMAAIVETLEGLPR